MPLARMAVVVDESEGILVQVQIGASRKKVLRFARWWPKANHRVV
jgi:hypothetical protein